MKIKKINIGDYGKLKDYELEPGCGINVFCGKNESGKSTLADFIRYMLYGFSKHSKLEKTKYAPWSEQAISGTMTVELSDNTILDLERKNTTRAISHIFTPDRSDIGSGTNAGEMFLGVDEELFCKTAYIAQNDISACQMSGVANGLQNITSSLDEDIDADEVKKKLNAQKNVLYNKGYKTGKIFELEQQKKELEAQLEKHAQGHKELLAAEFLLNETKAKIAHDKSELERINKEYENLLACKAKQKIQEIEAVKQKAQDSLEQYNTALENAKYGEFLPDEQFVRDFSLDIERFCQALNSCSDLKQQACKATDDLEQLSAGYDYVNVLNQKYQNQPPFAVANSAKNEIAKIKHDINANRTKTILFFVLVVTFPIAIYFFSKYKKSKQLLEALKQELGCRDIKELEKLINEDYPKYCDKASALSAAKISAQENYNNALKNYNQKLAQLNTYYEKLGIFQSTEQDNIELISKEFLAQINNKLLLLNQKKLESDEQQKLCELLCSQYNLNELASKAREFDGNPTQKDEKTLLKEIDFYERAIKALLEREKELIKKTSVYSASMPKPGETQSEIELVNSLLEQSYNELYAIELAQTLITQSFDEVKKDAAPALTELCAKMYERLSDGKYKMLYVDPELNLSFSIKNGDVSRQAFYLSGGTWDMAYITLRLALVDYIYKEKPVLIFDDAFCNFDDARLGKMLSLLCELEKQYQIFIFTCHEREGRILSGMGHGFKTVEMN